MIDRVILWSIRHRLLVIALAAGLTVGGLGALWMAPIDAIPDLSENQVIVYAEWPGHGPVEIQDQLSAPLTRALLGVSGVKTVRSSSDVGASSLWVIFDDGVPIDLARRRLTERLAESAETLQLPPGVVPRLAPNGPATGQVFWYTLESSSLDAAELRRVQDQLIKPALAAVPGVAEVASVGGMVAEIAVEADPVRLQLHHVDLLDVVDSVRRAGGSAGAGVVHKANAEFLVRSVSALGRGDEPSDRERVLADLCRLIVPTIDGRTVLLDDVAEVSLAPGPRRGAMEKDGREVCGGVVLMAYGENPLRLTERLKARIEELLPALPAGVRLVPVYDRTPLVRGAVETVSRTILEAMVVASVCVVLMMFHARAALVVAVTLPLSVLTSFLLLEVLRRSGLADIPVNTMSLAGLAISIGVLVDSAIVMTENVLHGLHQRFGESTVRGDVSGQVAASCMQVGRPMVFAILIMLLSFLPVFALGGMEGKMFRPLATTKSLALLASAGLAITLVPALSALLIRGRARGEDASPLVRGVIAVYRPVLDALLDRPGPLVWIMAVTFTLAAAAVGQHGLFLGALGVGMLAVGVACRTTAGRVLGLASLVLAGLVADTRMTPIGREFLTPLDEGMVMDMPISVPRVSIVEGIDDLKARDMVLCRFPEVAMVVGKLGRAETPTDPAPLDMIESMVELHPREYWPERVLEPADAARQARRVCAALAQAGLTGPLTGETLAAITDAALVRLDGQLREYAYQRNRDLFRSPGFDEVTWKLRGLGAPAVAQWNAHMLELNAELRERAAAQFTRVVMEEAIARAQDARADVRAYIERLAAYRAGSGGAGHHASAELGGHAMSRTAKTPPELSPLPELEAIHEQQSAAFARGLSLRRLRRDELLGFGGALDRAVSMPGWTNVWTMPIQNRVDMLSTGVNTTLGIRVLGRDLDTVVNTSEAVAKVVRTIEGATGVVCDPVRGKGTVEVRTDLARAAQLGVRVGDADRALEAAMAGTVATTADLGGDRVPVRVRCARSSRNDEESVERVLVRSQAPRSEGTARLVPLSEVAEVTVVNGPATLKGENGDLRNYVRLNVKDRDVSEFLAEARARIGREVALPADCRIEWTGQFEHEARARQSLLYIVPLVLVVIAGLLFATFRDVADAALILLAIPGVLCGGILFQWALGAPLSITVWVGYVACFGMATATGVIMLVYLRDAVERAGGLPAIDAGALRSAVLDGAAQRLRPKLLTEVTTVFGLIPLLLAGGVGSEVIRPMVAPVLGGILVADEVIDLLLPILFYRVRLWRWRRLHGKRGSESPTLVVVGAEEGR
jgi:Cu(I)/Ag(I) efflux system membrane protein CusA/SilA